MTVTATLVRELREKTGVGMMECKKALVETDGNFDEAIKFLREKGHAAASKKSDRDTREGRICIAVSGDQKQAVLIELNCETDFVASNEQFVTLGQQIAEAALKENTQSVEGLDGISVNGKDFKTVLSEAILTLGENITVGSVRWLESPGAISSYVHMNGKIGVMVSFDGAVDAALGKDIAMHVAAAAPSYVTADQVPESELQQEREIARAQSLNDGKPEAVVDKIVEGKIKKYLKDICLVDQVFIKDSSKTIQSILQGGTIKEFVRVALTA